ncbi:MAG: pentapeptide repeat-containing protein [Xenococcus sp. (in: cyanobacteria)]
MLHETNLTATNLLNANLGQADLSQAILTQAGLLFTEWLGLKPRPSRTALMLQL